MSSSADIAEVGAALADAGVVVDHLSPMSNSITGRTYRAASAGRQLFVKSAPGTPGMLATEAAGLRWLRDAGAPTPKVVAVTPALLVTDWLDAVRPSGGAAEAFGRRLALLHQHHPPAFGLPPDGCEEPRGWMGALPMEYGSFDSWAPFYLHARIEPTAKAAADRGALTAREFDLIMAAADQLLKGPASVADHAPASMIHGDLWSGNVLWQNGGAVMIDPAAHAGHPEADLAMLALFGVSHFADIVAGYVAVRPLADGWRHRIPLHQLYPLLVHAVLFGGSYGAQSAGAATAALRSARNRP